MQLAGLGLRPRAGRPRFVPAPNGPPPRDLELWLDVGDEGELDVEGGRACFRVIGIMHRSIRVEGERFTWEEYVLHSAAEGLRWLVVADGHWNLVESIEAGQVEEIERGEGSATYRGETFRFLSSGKARVEVKGRTQREPEEPRSRRRTRANRGSATRACSARIARDVPVGSLRVRRRRTALRSHAV
ncbi:DUF4178 domain-containing protein [Salmonella enterica]|uniref:DUF4178 domain-containing protein n=1 Tax=Salmonella enterica subsp. enterica serovar Dessau TaxID=2564349 RepID=A0A8E5INC0_SALET|nr:DUF4178 domain-containing protein [Salmonella enterica]QUS47016.1 DUF4178 domain-containing protein [Salmonella enterica subsp. enterica serovar Dessau]